LGLRARIKIHNKRVIHETLEEHVNLANEWAAEGEAPARQGLKVPPGTVTVEFLFSKV